LRLFAGNGTNFALVGGVKSPILEFIQSLHYRYKSLSEGHVADYIPELAQADPNGFGICVATRDGHLYEAGDTRKGFTIQSISKAFAYGLALEDRGEEHVLAKIGVEPSGEAFNAISLKEGSGKPFNPMINAGAIATCGQVLRKGNQSRIQRITHYLSCCAGQALNIDEAVYRSESATGHRNRAIGWMLRNFGILDEDPDDTLETYFQQCSLRVTCADLAVMGATLANQGINPISGERAIASEYVDNVLGVMATCGMYDWSGEWLYRVGLPAKSGVGGGILAVLPGQLGIGVYSPPLDDQGNSVRGIRVCLDLARDLALHLFNPSAAPQPALRLSYTGNQVMSRRRRRSPEFQVVKRFGERTRVLELQGPLVFSTFEPVMRTLVRHAPYCRQVVVNFRHVVSADAVSFRLLSEIRTKLDQEGVNLLCCHAARFVRPLLAAGIPSSSIFDTDDAALEACEEATLAEMASGAGRDSGPIDLRHCDLFAELLPEELQLIETEGRRVEFTAGEMVIASGSPAGELLVMLSGLVEISLISQGGRTRQRLDVLSPGMTFGEMAFIDGANRSADVIALEPSECLVLDRQWFDNLDQSNPALKIKLFQHLARQLSNRLRQANLEISALKS
jgi:glutaminase